jgi:hypothetical protein
VQGYVYDAKRRVAGAGAGGLARPRARRALDKEADELRKRFDEAFWVEDRGGFYALALDGDKQQVDSLCSNIGPPAVERHRAAEARRRRRRPADGRRAVVGLGRADDVDGRRRLQPARVPQRHRVAARQLDHRGGSRATRAGPRRSA